MRIISQRLCLLITFFTTLTVKVLVLSGSAVPSVEAQSCNNIPNGSGESITADISVRDTGQALSETGLVPTGTVVDINALATAFVSVSAWACTASRRHASARKRVQAMNGPSTKPWHIFFLSHGYYLRFSLS